MHATAQLKVPIFFKSLLGLFMMPLGKTKSSRLSLADSRHLERHLIPE
jgi:hypothetical protein